MGLREYHKKRDFSLTAEPRGKEAAREGRSYVIQKHAASHLHYDFRLGLEGVLRSWLLFKCNHGFPKPAPRYSVVEKRPESVATGRTLEDIAKEKDRVWKSNRAEKAAAEKPRRAKRAPAIDATSIPGARKGALPRF